MKKSKSTSRSSSDKMPLNFSTLLKKWRRLNGIKQEVLAHQLGVSQSTISLWENGHESPSDSNIRKLRAHMASMARDEQTIEQLFVRRQRGIRALCDFDGIDVLETSLGFKSLWPETARLTRLAMADHLVNESRDFIFDTTYSIGIKKGEIGLVSGISQRITDLDVDSEIKCEWHLCFRRYGYRTLIDVVFEPCKEDIDTGITDIQYLT